MIVDERVAVLRMDQHGTGLVHKVLNSFFRNAVLSVMIDSTEGEGLSGVNTGFLEFSGSINTIVRIVVLDGDAKTLHPTLEFLLGMDDILGTGARMSYDVVGTGEGIDEDGGNLMTVIGREAFGLLDETGSGTDNLVGMDDFARRCGFLEVAGSCLALGAPASAASL